MGEGGWIECHDKAAVRVNFVKIKKKGWQSLINTQQLFAMIIRKKRKEKCTKSIRVLSLWVHSGFSVLNFAVKRKKIIYDILQSQAKGWWDVTLLSRVSL